MGMSLIRLGVAGLLASVAKGIEINLDDASSVEQASSQIGNQMLSAYTGNQTGDNPGNLPPPYYWWEAGAMFMHMVDYYYYTGDPSNNKATVQAICWQAGENGQFMPPNQTKNEGNDDQVFWAYAAMSAAELKFVDPQEGYPSWTAMAQAVFNLQTERWKGDEDTCGGGLRWQIQAFNLGYDYKNIASNGGYFLLAARLARYTGNQTYTDWTEKSWKWITESSLYEVRDNGIKVNDGADTPHCKDPNTHEYSYNYALLIGGLAYIYNATEDQKWIEPLNGLMDSLFRVFFDEDKIMFEAGCEPYAQGCNTDGLTFKSFTMRWLAVTAQLVPQTADRIWPYIEASAKGAAQQCSGPNGLCGYHWNTTEYDGTKGVGQGMSALAAIQANLINLNNLDAPSTLKTGATSKSDPSAGTHDSSDTTDKIYTRKITTGDKAGAGILTFLALAGTIAGTYWLVWWSG